jgi:hypothetical protein
MCTNYELKKELAILHEGPSRRQLMEALVDLLEGVQAHEIPEQTGLSFDRAEEIMVIFNKSLQVLKDYTEKVVEILSKYAVAVDKETCPIFLQELENLTTLTWFGGQKPTEFDPILQQTEPCIFYDYKYIYIIYTNRKEFLFYFHLQIILSW